MSVKQDGTLQVMRVLHRETPKPADEKPRMTLSEWACKWGGTMKLEPGETFEDVKRAAYRKKFGL